MAGTLLEIILTISIYTNICISIWTIFCIWKRFLLLALWEGNPSIISGYLSHTYIDAEFLCVGCLNKLLNRQSSCRWYETSGNIPISWMKKIFTSHIKITHEGTYILHHTGKKTLMGPIWGHLGPTGPKWTPCWPHELCYLGNILLLLTNTVSMSMS